MNCICKKFVPVISSPIDTVETCSVCGNKITGQIVTFGGGVNSTAVLVGMAARGIVPDAILFADTGGERPETYDHIKRMSLWCKKSGFPQITTVKSNRAFGTLEYECLARHILPGLVYGFKTCSVQWKKEPVDRWLKENGMADAVRIMGIDAGESHRMNYKKDGGITFKFPLIEWGWGRDECIAEIKRAGLCPPNKSSCFFCPAMKKREILQMWADHPDLIERAIFMERNAKETLTSIKGLGRDWSWESFLKSDREQGKLFSDVGSIPCMCFDGENE